MSGRQRLVPGKAADLLRRARLTLEYQGPRELAFRVVTAPLRPTPLGRHVSPRHRRKRTDEVQARRWYRANGRPVTVVVPTYGDPSLVEAAVASIRRTTDRARVRVVVVDDGSPDPAHRARLAGLAGARVELRPSNAGFAAAANHGIALAPPGEDVVVLNSDVVARRGWLERLQRAAYEGDRIGIAGPMLLYPDNRIQSAGSYRNLGAPQWFDHRHRFKEAHDLQANLAVPVLATTGACMYLRRELLDAVGGFDEGYGMGYEDVDICLRAWEAGWSVEYAPGSVLEHHESQTRPVDPGERELASQRRFWDRWTPFFEGRDVRTPDGRLRVVYVTLDTGVGGGHRDIFEHLNRLAERGHDVALYTLADPPEWFDLQVPVRSFEDYSDLIAALEPLAAIKIATWWATGSAVWRAGVRNGVPVFFVQDIETSYYPGQPETQAAVLNGYRQEFRYMTISGWNRERLAELSLDAAIVPPGLDVGTFRPLPDVARRDDMLLAIGRTNPLKNLPLTIDAWNALGPGGPELCLFGIEPELGPEYGARYVERPTDAGVNVLLNQATVFVQTSRHEGFCLPPLESMATGGAVVCTDAHGNRDFCVDGVNCLIPEPTVESVTGAIRRLLEDPQLRERLGRAGLETAAGFAWERRIDELEAFFEGVAGQRSSAMRGADLSKIQ